MARHTDPIAVLRARVTELGSQRAVARALGVSDPFISDLLRGRRRFSDRMLAQLGLQRAVVRTRKAAQP